MTLVLTCLTSEYIVQVSDRRLTLANDPEKIHAEDANKAVFLDEKYIFGFTGLARLAGKRTDLWFAEEIIKSHEQIIFDRLSALGASLPAAVAYAPKKFRRLAFVGAGYGRMPDGAIRPGVIQLSNFLRPDGRPKALTDEFGITVLPIPHNRDFLITETGAQLFEGHRRGLHQSIRSARKREADAAAIAQILAAAVWRVAKYNPGVGTNLMICVLPRNAIENGVQHRGVMGGINFLPDQTSFFYVGPETEKGIRFGPTVISGGMIQTDIKISFGNTEKPIGD